jgi:hypothetical protein
MTRILDARRLRLCSMTGIGCVLYFGGLKDGQEETLANVLMVDERTFADSMS